MKKIQKNKIVLSLFVFIFIFVFSFSSFADVPEGSSEYVLNKNPLVLNPSGATVDYSLAPDSNSVFKVEVGRKTQGAWGSYVSTYDYVGNTLVPFRISFKVSYDTAFMRNRFGPRMYIWYGQENSYNQGFMISFNEHQIQTANINSFSLKANSSKVTEVGYFDLDEGLIYDPDLYWDFYIDIIPQTGQATLYFVPYGKQAIELHTSSHDIADFYPHIFGLGIFDAIPYNMAEFPEGSTIGVLQPEITNLGIGYQIGFEDGYDSGFIAGRAEGFDSGFNAGYSEGEYVGYEDGYFQGKQDGLREGSEATGFYLDIPAIINSIFGGTSSILGGFLDWEIFGINILGVLVALVVVSVVVFVVKKLRS